LSQPNYIEQTLKQAGNGKQTLENLRDFLVTDKPLSFDDCIFWARNQFEIQYNNTIQQLLYNFPRDSKTSTGQLFWSGPKRAPTPLKFDSSNPTHLGFIIATANLHAYNYGIRGPTADKEYYRKVVDNMIIPEFTPSPKCKDSGRRERTRSKRQDHRPMTMGRFSASSHLFRPLNPLRSFTLRL
jgi:ubiquitin-activating enzyme E1